MRADDILRLPANRDVEALQRLRQAYGRRGWGREIVMNTERIPIALLRVMSVDKDCPAAIL